MSHIHVHLHKTKDSGTSEGAKKAAATRKAHGGGGEGSAAYHPQAHQEAVAYHQKMEAAHKTASENEHPNMRYHSDPQVLKKLQVAHTSAHLEAAQRHQHAGTENRKAASNAGAVSSAKKATSHANSLSEALNNSAAGPGAYASPKSGVPKVQNPLRVYRK